MNRRALTAMLVAILALSGAGLPRFAHVMTAHLPGDEGAAACTRCCTQCSLSSAAAEPADAAEPGDEPREEGGSTETHDCAICALLATLVTNVFAMPCASPVWLPVASFIAEAPASIASRHAFDPHAPRGPPPLA